MIRLREDAIDIWKAGVAAVHGSKLVENSVRVESDRLCIGNQTFELDSFDRILVVGGGKFSHDMAAGLERSLGPELARQKSLSGIVTVPDGANQQVSLRFITAAECRPSGANLPTARVLAATGNVLELLQCTDEKTLVLALISGGGSALLEKSVLPLADIIGATQWLSHHGASILQLNAVRIAISDIKGGGLARAMPAGTLCGLIVSDVPGDDYRFVSSGPTFEFGDDVFELANDALTQTGAREDDRFPRSVTRFLESPRRVDPVRVTVKNVVLGNPRVAREAAMAKATELGYQVGADVLSGTTTCEQIADVASRWCSDDPAPCPQCVVSMGEPTVEPGDGAGQGGRNQHAVLATIEKLFERRCAGQFCFLSGGTDGEDGNTSVAGAIVTDRNMKALLPQRDRIRSKLAGFDSHPFLAENGLVFRSGPTSTNVTDLRVLLRQADFGG